MLYIFEREEDMVEKFSFTVKFIKMVEIEKRRDEYLVCDFGYKREIFMVPPGVVSLMPKSVEIKDGKRIFQDGKF